MGYDLCIIDDAFMGPAIECKIERHGSYTGAGLSILMQQKTGWEREPMVHELCSLVLGDMDEVKATPRWVLRAFSNPEFFINAFEDENYRSDIIIFDWEYMTEVDQVFYLRKILTSSHASIIIYSQQEIDKIKPTVNENLEEFINRILIIDKSPDESFNALLRTAKQMQEESFAFKFGKELRTITNKSLDDILCRLSSIDFNKVIDCLVKQNDDAGSGAVDAELKTIISSKIKDILKESPELNSFLETKGIPSETSQELLELTSETIKNHIVSACNFFEESTLAPESTDTPLPFEDLWSYRLYHTPRADDKMVRTGDLIKEHGANSDILFFVLNGDCDLQHFWKKCGGMLVLVELLNISSMSSEIQERAKSITSINSKFKQNFREITSFSNGNSLSSIAGAPILIPYVPVIKGGVYADYLLFPLRVSSYNVPIIDGAEIDNKYLAKSPLIYDYIKYERVCSISEPFAAPLKWTILSHLYGWGSPDYPEALQKNLSAKIKGIFQ